MGNAHRLFVVAMAAAVIGCGPDSGPGLLGSGGTSGAGSGGSSGNASGGSSGNGGGSGGDNGGPTDAAGSGGDNGSGGANGSGGDNGGGSGGSSGSGGTSGVDGGGTEAPPTGSSSGLPRSAAISDLTADQQPALCDWWNAKQGGYGQSIDCGGTEPEVTDGDQAECVDGLSACDSATVADFEDCANAMGTDLCKFRTAPACATLANCFGM
jgi:hypothetical protein